MDLLYISPSPPNELERVRSLNLIKAFKENNINITLITLYNKKQEKYLDDVSKYVDKLVKVKYSRVISSLYAVISLFLPISTRVGYCFNFKMIKKLKSINKEYDIVYIKRLRMAQYKKYVKAKKIYIDITDSLTKYYERLYRSTKGIKKLFYFEEYYKLKKYEVKTCEENKNIVICSEDDKDYIEKLSKKAENNINVIENVIDLSKWKRNNIKIKECGKRNKISFFGVMSYEPNILAAEYAIKNIMPFIDKKYYLDIIGPNVPNKIKRLENERIKCLGYVKLIEEELQKSDIFICPLFVGAGTKNKILQVGELGIPIICTNFALEGLPKEFKSVIYIANRKEEFLKKIEEIQNTDIEVLMNRMEKQKKIIEKYNSIEFISKKINKIILNGEKE